MQKYINGFQTTLALSLTDIATTATIADASALALGAGEFYIATLQSATGKEIIKITAVAGSELTIERGLEGTTATAFAIGDRCEIGVTASGLDGFLQRTEILDEDDFTSNSPTLPPSQQSTSAYVASYVANLNPFTLQGGLDGSVPDQLPEANAGDTYKITVSGAVSGVAVQSGDTAICTLDGTEANSPANWIFGQGNIEQSTTAEALAVVEDTKYLTALKNQEHYVSKKATVAKAEAGTDDSQYLTPAMGRIMARAMLGVGAIQMSANPTSPDPALWLPCKGETIGDTGSGATYQGPEYQELYDAIQTTYNNPKTGDVGVYNWADSSVVYLPNNQGLVPRGTGSQTWSTRLKDGWILGTYAEDQVQEHSHEFWFRYGLNTEGGSFTFSANYNGVNTIQSNSAVNPAIRGVVTNIGSDAARIGSTTRDSSISYNFYILY